MGVLSFLSSPPRSVIHGSTVLSTVDGEVK